MATLTKKTHGLVLGKFMPPHRGHIYLVDFARSYADELTIVVGSLAAEPIPGALRHAWMIELFPTCRVLHLTDENPQYPADHPDFWNIWRNSLQRIVEQPVDFLFASEDYGQRLAQELGAAFIPCGGMRQLLPMSATEVRGDLTTHWDALPPAVRPYFVKRVSVFGPESTGKTTLASRLAEHFKTVWVSEFARTWLEFKDCDGEGRREVELADMGPVARGQRAAEDALARQANRLLFCDTDPAATQIWSQQLFGQVAPEVARAGGDYALTLLLDVDVSWQPDSVRYLPAQREHFFQLCRQRLEQLERSYVVLKGSWDERWERALQAVAGI